MEGIGRVESGTETEQLPNGGRAIAESPLILLNLTINILKGFHYILREA